MLGIYLSHNQWPTSFKKVRKYPVEFHTFIHLHISMGAFCSLTASELTQMTRDSQFDS